MDDRLERARAQLHELNNAVAALRVQAALLRTSGREGEASSVEIERLEAAAEHVVEATRRVGASLGSASGAARHTDVREDGPHGTAPVVVVVDDDAVLRAVLTRLLAGQGYQVIAVHEAEEADGWLAAGRAADVLVCDIELPGRDGHWLTQRAREHRPDLPVLVLTGHGETEAIAASEVLAKPFAPADLLTAVERLVRLSRATPPPPGTAAPDPRTSPSA